jgi:hypothetical protein
MPTFITPYSGSAELTASNGLEIVDPGLWRFSQAGYNDGATFGLSLTYPAPTTGGLLHLQGDNWPIAVIGNQLTSYTDPATGLTYGPTACRITVTGNWLVVRQQNSNSYNSFNISYVGLTQTDLGERDMSPSLLTYNSPTAQYVKQGSAVTGGAVDTFSTQVFECKVTESSSSTNSNREYQSNTVTRPVFVYSYSKSWQIG